MKKVLFAVISALALASCSFWNAPIEEFFGYWASEPYITDSRVGVPNQSDGSGVVSVASDKNAVVLLNMDNPKQIRFVMPQAGSAAMIHFTGLEPQPTAGTDYTLEELSSSELKLTYSAQFLKRHEWGSADFGAAVRLYAEDGRKFNKPYVFSIKANTRPPEASVVLAETTESPAHYVLCLTVSGMSAEVNGEKLHKDIAAIEIKGTSYPLAMNAAGSDFVKPADARFIDSANVAQLPEAGSEAVPTAAWTLFYKTDVPKGGAYTVYPVVLRDEKGLTSETLEAGTTTNKPNEGTVTLTAGTADSGSGTAETDPVVIQPAVAAPEAQLQIASSTSGTSVSCTVTDILSSAQTQYSGNPVQVPLPLNGENEKLYEVKYHTKGAGYNPTAVKTKYYKILKRHTVTFNANGGKFTDGTTAKTAHPLHGRVITAPAVPPERDGFVFVGWYTEQTGETGWNFLSGAVAGDITLYAKWEDGAAIINAGDAGAWQKLKTEAAKASGVRLIVIVGEVKATGDAGNSGEITIGRDLTIQGQTGAGTDKLNVNAQGHRIFNAAGGKTLSLKNLTLTGGTAPSGQSGGAIYADGARLIAENIVIIACTAQNGAGIYAQKGAEASTVDLNNVLVQSCAATDAGGGIYIKESVLTMRGVKDSGKNAIKSCSVSNGNGGAIYNDGGTVTVTNADIDGAEASVAKSKNGGGIYMKGGTAALTGVTIRKYKASEKGGGAYIEGGSVTMTDCALSGNKATGGGGIGLKGGSGMTLTDCTIKGNEVTDGNGGGINFDGGTYTSTYKITGGEISNNVVNSLDGVATRSGGGIAVGNCAVDITIDGCAIQGNAIKGAAGKTPRGAGIWFGNQANAVIKDSVIQNNKAHETGNDGNLLGSGGGIQFDGGTLKLAGETKIVGNGAKDGGGAYVGGSFTMSGNAVVTPSAGTDENAKGKNDVYLKNGKTITVDDALTGSAPVARITPEIYSTAKQVLAGSAVGTEYEKFIVTPEAGSPPKLWKIKDNGYLQKGTVTIDGSKSGAWTKLKNEVEAADGTAKIIIKGTITANSTDKGEITVSRQLEITGEGTDAVLDAALENRIFKIVGAGNLTVKNLKLTNGSPSAATENGGAIYNERELTVVSCEIVENSPGSHGGGGGIYVKQGGKCTITGDSARKSIIGKNTADKGAGIYTEGECTIGAYTVIGGNGTGNKASQFGGGILVGSMGTCTIKAGAEISYNELTAPAPAVKKGGGIFVETLLPNKGKLKVEGASGNPVTIKENKATQGGGIFDESEAEISNAVIESCKADRSGGGIYAAKNGSVKLTDTAVKNCEAIGDEGGAIYAKGAVVELTNCVIAGNKAKDGGGIFAYKDSSTLSSVTVKGGVIGGTGVGEANSAVNSGGGVYISADCTAALEDGAKVIGNTASTGGGAYVQDASVTFSMSGSAVVTPSTGSDKDTQGKNDVYLATGAKIKLSGILNPQGGIAARISPDNYSIGRQVLTGSASAMSAHHDKFSVTPQTSPVQEWQVNNSGALQKKTP
ncbi:MAG: InlB B-repeat-containing protein [Treponema sp.]